MPHPTHIGKIPFVATLDFILLPLSHLSIEDCAAHSHDLQLEMASLSLSGYLL